MTNLPPPDPSTRVGAAYTATSNSWSQTASSAPYGASPAGEIEYAGFWNRVIARVADGLLALLYSLPLIIGGIFLIVLSVRDCSSTTVDGVTELNCTGDDLDVLPLVLGIAALIVGVLFNAVLYIRWIAKFGAGPLARRLGVKVVCQRTLQPIGYGRSIGRFFGQYISTWIFYLGYLWMLWDKDKQTWHDKMVNSIVIRTN
jgi:uncharacterized RDD family membrane protein YckC